MTVIKKGDCAFYQGLPTHELINGDKYFVEDIQGDMATVYETDTGRIFEPNPIKVSLSELYPTRKLMSLNNDIAYARYECTLKGIWTLPMEGKSNIQLLGLAKFQTEEYLKEINLTDIAGQADDLPERIKYHSCRCCHGVRFRTADTNKPIVVFSGLDNPGGEPYRTIDGYHRYDKRKWLGHTTIMAYVMPFEEVLPYANW